LRGNQRNLYEGVKERIYSKMFYTLPSISETIEEEYLASVVYEDNATCLGYAKMPKLSPRTKHIGLPYHWFRNKVSSLEIDIQAVSSADKLVPREV
jgi:hypothetical protein